MNDHATLYLQRLRTALDRTELESFAQVVESLVEARSRGRTVFTLGNGGSAALASHLAADLCRIGTDKGTSVRALSLTDSASLVTGWSNDDDYDQVFVRQLAAHLRRDDVVIAISCGGKSTNVLEALRFARREGARTIGFLGFDGGTAKDLVDHALCVPVDDYGIAETVHTAFCHMITEALGQG